jgi:hypothetical protein
MQLGAGACLLRFRTPIGMSSGRCDRRRQVHGLPESVFQNRVHLLEWVDVFWKQAARHLFLSGPKSEGKVNTFG